MQGEISIPTIPGEVSLIPPLVISPDGFTVENIITDENTDSISKTAEAEKTKKK